MDNSNKLAIGFCFVNIVAISSIIGLLISYATGKIYEYDEDGERENREEDQGLKLLFDLVYLMLTSGALFVPAWRIWSFSGTVSRLNLGTLAGSVLMFTNMMFVSFFYFKTFETENDDEEGNDRNRILEDGDEEEEEMDEEERLERQYFVVSNVCVALALIFAVTTGFIFREAVSIPEDACSVDASEVESAKSLAHVDIFYDVWKVLSVSTVVVLFIVFFAALVPLFLGDNEREREEGLIFNLIIIVLWVAFVSVLLLVAGNLVLGKRKIGRSLGVGVFSGALLYFAALLFMVSVFYGNFQFEERGRDDGPQGSTVASFCCFFLALLHLSFALGIKKYRNSIVMAPSAAEYALDNDGTNFIRMGEPEVEMS
eukprot:CAMPEP_0194370524 /NCGR_PEP_ID=MMETSP0174-20130528/18824_1 /TAXON_ID=216777 /ORGANISM="Proboscia alata, Strain PI-D3" /LENGTH=370 /DNA_ID=CAMNT_0039148031 /DNA_START=264 /DNA_END=1376 /DNA_ORIENTATION=-